MIELLAFILAVQRPEVKRVNVTEFPWNDYDKYIVTVCQKRCPELDPATRCLKLFRKHGKQDYTCICGQP